MLTLNLLTIDFNSDAPAPAKMGAEPIPIFTLPLPLPLPQTLSVNGPLIAIAVCERALNQGTIEVIIFPTCMGV